ncbi:MAG TPA: SH3 domain-containing protein [Burkholderiales bacterium]|jgi:uncharacterized protein YgiM (DUF1202 family)|nr:SH3 domain-containing protein [Burkholderiales bacterium]
MKRWKWRLVVVGLLAALPVGAQEAGVALKDDRLRAEPYADAKEIGHLKKGAQVIIVKRSGGWYQVKSGSQQGWIRMLSVRRGSAGKTDVAKEVGGVTALASGRAGTGQVVSTTGVRGLSEEELKGAKFNAAQLAKAQSYATSAEDARRFAAQGKLESRSVAYLPDPAQTATAPAGGRR